MDNLQDFKNALANLECGWTNQWAFMDQKSKLLNEREIALKNKARLLKEGINVIDVYKQLDEFESCIRKQSPLTKDEEECIILAALEYVTNNRPIISSVMNKNLAKLYKAVGDTKSPQRSALRYRFDVYQNLISFYLGYEDEIELFDVFVNFLKFNQSLFSMYPEEKNNFYSLPYTISYLKYLVKHKQFEKAEYIVSNFTLTPIGKTDTMNLEKIKEKIYRRK